MASAKVTGEPYRVQEVSQKDILDFKSIAEFFNWPAAKTSKIVEITVKPKDMRFYVKYSWQEEQVKTLNIRKTDKTVDQFKNLKLQQKYKKRLPLTANKKTALQQMIQKNYIPTRYHAVYRNLIKI